MTFPSRPRRTELAKDVELGGPNHHYHPGRGLTEARLHPWPLLLRFTRAREYQICRVEVNCGLGAPAQRPPGRAMTRAAEFTAPPETWHHRRAGL
jgi:hypothetical protein